MLESICLVSFCQNLMVNGSKSVRKPSWTLIHIFMILSTLGLIPSGFDFGLLS